MSALKMTSIELIAAGILGLVYGSFSYTQENHDAKIGPMELSVKANQTGSMLVHAGVGANVIRSALPGLRWQERPSSALASTVEPCQAIAS
jgi:hypothetical protein